MSWETNWHCLSCSVTSKRKQKYNNHINEEGVQESLEVITALGQTATTYAKFLLLDAVDDASYDAMAMSNSLRRTLYSITKMAAPLIMMIVYACS
ncbi:hypothetical protein U1Q18_052131 [Sarracenia purpurea var. burkii]